MSQLALKATRAPWMKEIAELVTNLTGVQLGDKQEAMLNSRLEKRIRELKLNSPDEYLDYVRGHLQSEGNHLVSLLTTHHTFFFREFPQFEFLEKVILPKVIQDLKSEGRKTIRVWSAACSQGQEAYSLAMFLFHHVKRMAPEMTFEILGTDVDPESVKKAKNGVYRWHDVKEIPLTYLWNHWARGAGEIKDYVKAKASLKQHCKFEVQNLMQVPPPRAGLNYDIIFCRNVFIYFTPEQIKLVTNQMLKHLTPQGYLVVGTSESLIPLKLPLDAVSASIYVKQGVNKPKTAAAPTAATSSTPKPVVTSTATAPKSKVRVLCVDDSVSILSLLKRILVDDFEIVGTAKNGIEAREMASKIKFDVMTLDIHMPEQGGIEYLRKNMSPTHPPVVMISSVPREDSQLAFECLQLGASDYVEKPSLSDLTQRLDEIRTKIRCAASVGRVKNESTDIDRSFHTQFVVKNPDSKLRIIFCGAADRHKIVSLSAEFVAPQPPTVILMQGARGILPAIGEYYDKESKRKSVILETLNVDLKGDQIYLGDFSKIFASIKEKYSTRTTSLMVLGDVSKDTLLAIQNWGDANVILEDIEVGISANQKTLLSRTKHFVPYTSMAYHSNEYLAKVDK